MFSNPIVLLALIGVGYMIYRTYQNQEPEAQSDFHTTMLKDAARYLGPLVGLSSDDALAGLNAVLAGQAGPSELAPLQRIDYEVVKESADRACRNLHITLMTPEGGQTGHIHRRMSWDSLPAKIKEHFIAGTGTALTFLLLDRAPRPLV